MQSAWVAAAAVALWAATAGGQIVGPRPRFPPPQPAQPRRVSPAERCPDVPNALCARFGVDRAAHLARSSDEDERLRGIERAAAIGSSEALALLVQSLEGASPSRNDARARVAATRGLAAHTDQANVRGALLVITGSPPPRARGGEAQDAEQAARWELARDTAALALAQSKDSRAVDSLSALARASGAGAAASAAALAAFPPSAATSAWARPMTTNALRLAARTGDLRAIEPAIDALRTGDTATRATAIEALAALGDARVLEIAKAGVTDGDPRVRSASAAALVALGAGEGSAAVERLLGDDATAARGIELAERVHGVGVVRALAARAATAAEPAVRTAALAAIGRDPSDDAIDALGTFVRDPLLRADAADAIARSPAPRAMTAIEALAAPASDAAMRRLAVRAYVVRALTRGERSGAMDRAIHALAGAANAADRAVAVMARTALGDADVAAGLEDRDPQVRRAAAMGSLAHPTLAARHALLARSARETDPTTRRVLAAGLVDGDVAGRVPTRALFACARGGGADAALCALAFARRAQPADAADVDALLGSRDPVLRAHAARGLAFGDDGDGAGDPTRAGRLAAAYAYETDVLVRRALVLGLARAPREVPSVQAALGLAARLDPDAHVRWLAARALAGLSTEASDAEARQVAWLRLVDASGAPPAPGSTGMLVRSDGLAVPVAFDSDGEALVPGVPAGGARLVLAPRLDAAYAPSP